VKSITKSNAINIAGHALTLPSSMRGEGHYIEILDSVVSQLDAMLSFHRKVLVVRADLRSYFFCEKNTRMSKFMDRVKKKFRRMGLKRLGYVWCREQAGSPNQHYHLALFVNGSLFQTSHELMKVLRWHWEGYEYGSLWVPASPYHRLRRGDSKAFQQAFDRVSYLAKVATKQGRGRETNDYSASRLGRKAAA